MSIPVANTMADSHDDSLLAPFAQVATAVAGDQRLMLAWKVLQSLYRYWFARKRVKVGGHLGISR